MTQQIALNSKNWKIKTDIGFVDFGGVAQMGTKAIYELTFDDSTTIGATASHFFYTSDGREIAVGEMEIGVELLGIENRTLAKMEYVGEDMTYDIYDSATHTFFVNGLLSHNCQFISSDPLLIDTVVLAMLTKKVEQSPVFGTIGEIVFYKQPLKGVTYIAGMDVATGSGSDFTTIEVFEFPSLEQVAEWRSNTTSSVTAYHILTKMFGIFEKMSSTVYFSVENNGVGEGVIALFEADEIPPPNVEFVSETGQKRVGMTTTGKSKMKACIALKEMVERNTISIKSKVLVEELKQFVRAGGAYKAKPGGTDDLVMGTLIALRILDEMASFDQDAYDKLYAHAYYTDSTSEEWDENDMGMEFISG